MIEYENFSKALSNLTKGAELNPPYNIVEQAGIVALFEICFEQSWKLMKHLLEIHGYAPYKTGSATQVIKLAFQGKMIADEEGWLSLLKIRNILIHTYDEEKSLAAIMNIKEKYLSLFNELDSTIKAEWLPISLS